MAQRRIVLARRRQAAHALGALALSTLLGACATGAPAPAVVETPSAPSASDRFDANGATNVPGAPGAAAPVAWIDGDLLEVGAPETYTVVRGDTLWDISDRFLKDAWLWPTVWNYNPQIANPHLIYPGDEIALEYVDGRATLRLTRGGRTVSGPPLGAANASGVTKLSPRIRSESLDDAVPTIPGEAIRQFLVRPRVVDLETLRQAPYVLSIGNRDGHLIGATGNQIYARGDIRREQTRYGIYRRSETLIDPLSGELLGYEITHVADAKLLNTGDPARLAITSNELETIAGDILLPADDIDTRHVYEPRLPEIRGDGRVVSLVDAISRAGRDQVVVLNVGEESGVRTGDVLAIEQRGGEVIDRRGRGGRERVTLPNIRTGVVMVFRTFEKVSYALVMESTRPVSRNDIVTGI